MTGHQTRDELNTRLLFHCLKSRLNIDARTDVLAVYLYGSHVYGTSTDTSDYDLLLVMRLDFETSSHVRHYEQMVAKQDNNMSGSSSSSIDHNGNGDTSLNVVYDKDMTITLTANYMADETNCEAVTQNHKSVEFECHIMSLDIYVQFLVKHKPVMMLCMWLPNRSRWYETETMRQFREHFVEYCINDSKIRTSFLREAEVWCFARAKRLFMEGDRVKALKNLIHGIRYLLFALQIVQHGTITNWTAANHYFDACMSRNHDSFEQYQSEFRPVYDQLTNDLKLLLKDKSEVALNTDQYSRLMHYLTQHSIQYLVKQFPVTAFPISPNMFKLLIDTNASMSSIEHSTRHHVIDDCNNTIIAWDEERDLYDIVCYGMGKVMHHEDFLDCPLDAVTQMDHRQGFAKLDRGLPVVLYCHEDKWRVSTQCNAVEQHLQFFSDQPSRSEMRFWELFTRLGYSMPDGTTDSDKSFHFIMNDRNGKLVLHGVRSNRDRVLSDEEANLKTYWVRLGWQHPEYVSIDVGTPVAQTIEQLINLDHDTLDVTMYRGVVCTVVDPRNDGSRSPFQLCIDHGFDYYMSKLKYWDLNVAENGKSLQSLQSQHNVECVLNACRYCRQESNCANGESDAGGNDDALDMVVREEYALYYELFTSHLHRFNDLCHFVDRFYSVNHCCELDAVRLKRLLTEAFPMEQTGPLFMMNKLQLHGLRDVLCRTVIKPVDSALVRAKQRRTTAELQNSKQNRNNSDLSRVKPQVESKLLSKMYHAYLLLANSTVNRDDMY